LTLQLFFWFCCCLYLKQNALYFLQAALLAVHDVMPFFKSALFASNNFRYDAATKQIVHTFA
jgi:hypothetical protein